jgi:DNA mismatch repair protein MutS
MRISHSYFDLFTISRYNSSHFNKETDRHIIMTATATPPAKVTPMMAQWHACKKISKNALLFFRMGDFYEAFYDDAQTIARDLGITLTQRQGTPMCGIPVHTVESHVDKLVSKGHRVAIAEQMENPKHTKGLVKRDVTRLITPGTVVNSSLLSDNANNFFVALDQVGSVFGLTFLDVTTAEFRTIELESKRELLNELYRLRPSEFLSSEKFKKNNEELFADLRISYSFLHNTREDWHFDHQSAYDFLVNHMQVHSLDGFGLKGMVAGINASGALLSYIHEELRLPIEHINDIKTYTTCDYMSLDRITQRNLELTESLHDGSRRNTLLDVVDVTHTPMGGRLMRQWVKQPLLDVEAISHRQDGISSLLKNTSFLVDISGLLRHVRDLERLIMKVSAGYATPKDLVALRYSLEHIPGLSSLLAGSEAPILSNAAQNLGDPSDIVRRLATALSDDPPLRVSDGNIFRAGYNADLDELRDICSNSKAWLARYQAALRENTGIKTLRVGFNRVFGYYIEVSKGQAPLMPDTFDRKQTLANSERFISPELKDYEEKVLTAEDKISALENDLFLSLRKEIATHAERVKTIARSIALIDCIYSLAETARTHGYSRPVVDDSTTLEVRGGRHPVIENALIGEEFIPNDTVMSAAEQLFIITGPNMAGKSTYIRQVALITIMAQMGSYVPATKAHIGLVDKVFTRIGASDDLSRGQSTFMVEMSETANILNNATSRSLVILDEIGRGTSTYDGIAIAWSVAEYLLTAEGRQAKTLFATHYWELTTLETKIPSAVNYNVAVKEDDDGILFLHKIRKGGTDKSYGIHVAQLAGVPSVAISRAQEILAHLEKNANRNDTFNAPKRKIIGTRGKKETSDIQLLLFDPATITTSKKDPLLAALRKLDIETLTPLEALTKLAELKKIAS